MTAIYGLIGKKLTHSFSKKYFTEKFQRENIPDSEYQLFEIATIEEFPKLIASLGSSLAGLNVTIPYKQAVIPYLDGLDETAEKVGAVNVIKPTASGALIGYNSDLIGFTNSFQKFVPNTAGKQALVLGNGGAAKAVCVALENLAIPYKLVSRRESADTITYSELSEARMNQYQIVVNTTPLGMYPNVEDAPALPYQALPTESYLYDLVYNPEETLFMRKGLAQGAKAKNGLEMLHGQAEAAWEIWQR